MKKRNGKFTIAVDDEIKEEFKKYCEKEGLKPGKQIEKYMLEVLMNK